MKGEFGKYGQILDKVQKKLQEASKTIDEVSIRKRQIDRKLNGVELLPDADAIVVLGMIKQIVSEIDAVEQDIDLSEVRDALAQQIAFSGVVEQ